MDYQKEIKIIISLWAAGSCGRKQLAGILRYANAGKLWNTQFIMDPSEFDAATIRRAEQEGVDGFIAFVNNDETAAALASTKIPTVLLSFPTATLTARKTGMIRFVNDNEDIGRLGADHFLSLGQYADYGFVPDRKIRGWSPLREQAFATRLAEAGKTCRVFKGEETELAQWLTSLRKPAAIMAPFDFRAKEVLMACKSSGLAVPREVAILGVDDDELICENVRPALSSIRIDQELVGYQAAKALDSLMRAKTLPKSKTVIVHSDKLIARESTHPLAPIIGLVNRINNYIKAHWNEPIGINDIARELRVSRRLIDLRYHEATQSTVRQALEDKRLSELKRLLRTTDLPIARLTKKCGFTNELWIKYVFKRREGVTMSQYRKA